MTILRSHDGQTIQVLSDTVCIKLKSQQSANRMAVVTVEVPPGGFVPPHLHCQEEESYYLLEGSLLLQLDQEEITIGPHDFVHIPAETIHGYRNASDRPVRFLAWTVGGAIDEFFIDMSEKIQVLPDDLVNLPEILNQHGIQMVS